MITEARRLNINTDIHQRTKDESPRLAKSTIFMSCEIVNTCIFYPLVPEKLGGGLGFDPS